jgi:hypothetical protein
MRQRIRYNTNDEVALLFYGTVSRGKGSCGTGQGGPGGTHLGHVITKKGGMMRVKGTGKQGQNMP